METNHLVNHKKQKLGGADYIRCICDSNLYVWQIVTDAFIERESTVL